ncbi:YTH domain-containing protein ECT4 isoform X2 [Malania oleifera]|uniref:YTH domain-containing protein ECT4 isoform X2 n=1 Tax=Malania oleifera TaxID=397392 RepID=UPI0025ADBE07|nr:YTH domain-containing protein ECT4 isoform X2 [Malania oleifera]
MAGEQKIENSKLIHDGMKLDSSSKMAERDMISGKDGVPSDSTPSVLSLRDATPNAKGETDQKSAAEQGVNHSPTSHCNYYYPGYDGAFSQLDDHGYFRADGSYTGIQSDNGSLVYYMPGFDQYTPGTFMGVEGQCHQPYLSSSGYLQPTVSYGSEAMPCYSWDSTFVGNAPNGTTATLGKEKYGPAPNASMKMNSLNSLKYNGPIAGKSSVLPLDSKSRPSAASSNFSKSNLHTPPLKPLSKVPHLGPEFQSGGFVKAFQSVGKFSSFTNQKQDVFPHNGPMNYKPNGRVWYGNDRYKLREKSNRNGGFEGSAELTRGPRAQNRSLVDPAVAKVELGLTVRRDQYNQQDFQTRYEIAKFYVIKSYSEDDIHKSIKYDVWASTPNGNKKLDAAFHDAGGKASETRSKFPIFLFFSVNGSGQFVGLAEMIGQVDFNKDMDFWQLDKWNGFFPVKWHIIKDIPNTQLRHIILENNDNRPVTYTRDTQEIGLQQGLEMLEIFKSFMAKTSILDDFNFYENREKLLHAKRSNNSASPQTAVYSNGDFRHLKSGERKVEEPRRAKRTPDSVPSLIHLTRNLSLNARPPKSSAVSDIHN